MILLVIKSHFVHQLSLSNGSPYRGALVLQNPDFASSWSVMILHPQARGSIIACDSSH